MYIRNIFLFLIKIYQKYLSVISFGSCRYYPSCSHYAVMQFEHNNIFKAFYLSIIRIIKCNPMSDGGFDHPCTKLNIHKVDFKLISVKYWYVPNKRNNYFVLQNWKRNTPK